MSQGVARTPVVVDRTQAVKVSSGGYRQVRKAMQDGVGAVLVPGRNGDSKARTYFLDDSALAEKLDQWRKTGRLPSPYTKSVLSDLIMALRNLGLNQVHPVSSVMEEMKRLMSLKLSPRQERLGEGRNRVKRGITDWVRFSKRPKRSKTGKHVIGKIVDTALSLRKVSEDTTNYPIGLKLAQMGCCVDVFRIGEKMAHGQLHDCEVFLRLNTHSVEPLKEWYRTEEEIPDVDMSAPTMGP